MIIEDEVSDELINVNVFIQLMCFDGSVENFATPAVLRSQRNPELISGETLQRPFVTCLAIVGTMETTDWFVQ